MNYEKEIGELKRINEDAKQKISQQILSVFEKVLTHRVKYAIDKLEDVHKSYESL